MFANRKDETSQELTRYIDIYVLYVIMATNAFSRRGGTWLTAAKCGTPVFGVNGMPRAQ